ncbi:MAG: LemA family protein [Gemmataceae bacterium]|jgi:LemA protein|nr:LemA family protein [Gemmataceae bacterium]
MTPILTGLLIVAGIVAVLAMFLVGTYNGLVVLRQKFQNAFAQIDVQLKRRHDLIPNLLECVKGYMAHEKNTLEAVIQARNTALTANQAATRNPGDPEAMKKLGEAEGQLNSTLSRLLMVAEAYPDLKANQNMMQFQGELTDTENRISLSRQTYNDSVTAYNTQRETFPTVVFASMLGFLPASLFEISAGEREAPKVSFS